MQLILETEALAIEKDMSTIENIQNEKLVNGVEDSQKNNCNGNKENIGDNNVITNDDVNKQVVDEVDDSLVNAPIDTKLEDKIVESNNEGEVKEEIEEIDSSRVNDTQIEESQSNGEVEGTNSNDVEETNNIPEEKEEDDDDMDYEDDIISIKQEHFEQILDIVDKSTGKTENTVTENTENMVQKNTENTIKEDPENTVTENTVTENTENEVMENIETAVTENIEKATVTETAEDIENINKTAAETVTAAETATEKNYTENIKLNSTEEKVDPKNEEEVLEKSAKNTELCDSTTALEKESSISIDKQTQDSAEDRVVENTETPKLDSAKIIFKEHVDVDSPIELKDDMDVEEVIEETKSNNKQDLAPEEKETTPVNTTIDKPIVWKLSNTLDILSDDEEELPKEETPKEIDSSEKQCINIEDDDDIMLIDEDTNFNKTETPLPEPIPVESDKKEEITTNDVKTDSGSGEKTVKETDDLFAKPEQKDSTPSADVKDTIPDVRINEKEETKETKTEPETPLLPDNVLKTAKKNLADMTREDLEEFCILKIVESLVDRSNLSEIKNKLKTMAQGIEEYRKKAMMLTKQNRDLQVVLKSVQEEQKKMTPDTPITPLKITRSVGMQVFMEKSGTRRKCLAQLNNPAPNNVPVRPNARNMAGQGPRQQKPAGNQPIPVPRLVPANSPAMKTPNSIPVINQTIANKIASPMPNGIKLPSPVQKQAEKRQHNRTSSVTVDLTDDEPPTKINNNRTSPAPPVRVVPSQNLMATPRPAFASSVSSPRKVYIPISGPQSQTLRPGQTIMLKSVPTPGLRPRGPTPQVPRMQAGAVRVNRIQTGRHPAPLPDCMKQYQPPNWKALPPAPDLKLSKVENGIVISWKIEGYQEDSYEEIASYQLYAYQETSSPPSTSLWKKIGDVKALPLPMACTLTQFMAGFKYYFAVRAVDIRSRLGPFSLPGSILLLNKL